MIEAVLIDVMDTVVHDPYRAIPGFFGLELAAFWPLIQRAAWLDFERAIIDEPTFLRTFFRDGRDFDHEGFLGMLGEGYRFLDGMEPLLADLRRASVPLHALSNYPIWYRRIEDKLGLSRFLSWSFVSWQTGLRKPDPEAYRHAARTLDLPVERCLFVDDRASNCDAARALGMPAVQFVGATALRAELIARGLLSA